MNEKLYNLLMKLPRANLISLMWSALDEMQAYNGRSKTECICEALGMESTEDDDGNTRYLAPSFASMRRDTDQFPFFD